MPSADLLPIDSRNTPHEARDNRPHGFLEGAYSDLRRMASAMMRRERADHHLQATALVNEAALRLMQTRQLTGAAGRSYLFGAMATAMRRVLVDYARRSRAARRGGGRRRLALEQVVEAAARDHGLDPVELADALMQLRRHNRRQGEIVQLRFLAGMTFEEIAEHLGVCVSTVEKDWRQAREWLRRELGAGTE